MRADRRNLIALKISRIFFCRKLYRLTEALDIMLDGIDDHWTLENKL